MKSQLLIVLLLTTMASCTAAPNASPVPLLEFKPGMIDKKLYKGQLKYGKRWKDNRGENIVILTESGVYWKDVYEATRSAKLYAYHFIKQPDSTWKEVLKMNDIVDDCAFNIRCQFFNNSLTITDLDADGMAEVAFAYAVSCKGETDPDGKKLILYEGADKYLIQGTTMVMKGKKKWGGEKVVEKKFEKAPDAFLDFASKQWDMFGVPKDSK